MDEWKTPFPKITIHILRYSQAGKCLHSLQFISESFQPNVFNLNTGERLQTLNAVLVTHGIFRTTLAGLE